MPRLPRIVLGGTYSLCVAPDGTLRGGIQPEPISGFCTYAGREGLTVKPDYFTAPIRRRS